MALSCANQPVAAPRYEILHGAWLGETSFRSGWHKFCRLHKSFVVVGIFSNEKGKENSSLPSPALGSRCGAGFEGRKVNYWLMTDFCAGHPKFPACKRRATVEHLDHHLPASRVGSLWPDLPNHNKSGLITWGELVVSQFPSLIPRMPGGVLTAPPRLTFTPIWKVEDAI
jgi:hypothetical protein